MAESGNGSIGRGRPCATAVRSSGSLQLAGSMNGARASIAGAVAVAETMASDGIPYIAWEQTRRHATTRRRKEPMRCPETLRVQFLDTITRQLTQLLSC